MADVKSAQEKHDEVIEEGVSKLYERFLRIKDRAFAPLRVLRYRMIAAKMRKLRLGK